MTDRLETLDAGHDALDASVRDCVRTISNFAATLDVLGRPDANRVERALQATEGALDELADWLEAFRSALEAARDDEEAPSFEALSARVDAWEPPPSPPEGPDAPAATSDDSEEGPGELFESASPLHLLSAPYDILLEAEGQMFRERVKRPYRFVELKRLWSDVTYLGEQRASAGLAARLGIFYEWVDRAEDETPDDAPWGEDDVEGLRELVERAETILDWSRDEVEERERERWVERVSRWVETADAEPSTARNTREMMMRFLTEVPDAPDDRVRDLLERIETNEDFPDEVRNEARSSLS